MALLDNNQGVAQAQRSFRSFSIVAPQTVKRIDRLRVKPELPQQAPYFEIPPKYRLQKYPVAGAGEAIANAGIYFHLRNDKEVDRRDQEMLLLLNARQMFDSSHIAVILNRRRQPGQKFIADLP